MIGFHREKWRRLLACLLECLVDKSNLGPAIVLKPLANYKTEGEKLLAFNSRVVGDKGVIEMTKNKSWMQFFMSWENIFFGWLFFFVFFLGLFPLHLYMFVVLLRQVYRTFPSLIEDVWDFLNYFFGEILIIIIAQKEFPKKLIFCPKKDFKKN